MNLSDTSIILVTNWTGYMKQKDITSLGTQYHI